MNIQLMRSAYIVQHLREHESGNEDVKIIGIYSSRSAAEAAVGRAKKLSGFRSFPNGFYIDEHEIDKDHWTEGFVGEKDDGWE